MADRNTCVDKDGGNHFGEYGFFDGYQGSIGNCRCGLKSRSGACKDVDSCIEQAHLNIADKKDNIVSYNINNMVAGENQRKAEEKADKEKELARREQEKKELAERKAKEEALKEGKIICEACKEVVDVKGEKEVSNGVVKCPKCEKLIEGQTGKIVVGAPKEEKKEEPKKEEPTKPEVKETPKDEKVAPEVKPDEVKGGGDKDTKVVDEKPTNTGDTK